MEWILLYYYILSVYKYNMYVYMYVYLLIVSHFIFLLTSNLREKLDLNFQVLEAKGKVDREKCILLVTVETPEVPHSPILCYVSCYLKSALNDHLCLTTRLLQPAETLVSHE